MASRPDENMRTLQNLEKHSEDADLHQGAQVPSAWLRPGAQYGQAGATQGYLTQRVAVETKSLGLWSWTKASGWSEVNVPPESRI